MMDRAWWPLTPQPGNLGDVLTAWMMVRDGVKPVWTDESPKILGIGSIIAMADKDDAVWTSGCMWAGEVGSVEARYLAVRGPRTQAALWAAGVSEDMALGDGALCLPRYYTPVGTPKVWELSVIPHYIDMDHRDGWPESWRGAHEINTLTVDVPWFVEQIVASERVESSSLHGCVVAQAYGVPWKWVRLGDRLSGDDTKFLDFEESLPFVDIERLMELRPWIAR